MESALPVAINRSTQQSGWRERGTASAASTRLPLLLLHGLMGSRLSWEPQLETLGNNRFVAAWDLPGYGDSAPLNEPASFHSYADRVIDWADTLGLERFHLAGLSFGGMIAQYVAANHGDRLSSLALLSSSPKFGLNGTTVQEWKSARVAPLDAGQAPSDFAPRVLKAISGPHISGAALEEQIRSADRVHADGLRTSIDVLVTHDSRPFLTTITTPTVCIVGSLDEETPIEYSQFLRDHIPNAKMATVPDAGHLLNVEAPHQINTLLELHMSAAETSRTSPGR